jgi:hypothetical protein
MTYKIGEIFQARDNFHLMENSGAVNYKLKKGDIAEVIKIRANTKFSVQIKINENIYNFTPHEMKIYFYSQAEWREKQINSILDE